MPKANALSRSATLLATALLVLATLANATTDAVRIVARAASTTTAVVEDLAALGARDVTALDGVGMVTATIDARHLATLAADPDVAAVWRDARLHTSSSEDAGTTGDGVTVAEVADVVEADVLHARGTTGAGIDVAIIDTGIVPTGSLGAVVDDALDLSFDVFDKNRVFRDDFGHGTHLAGIVHGMAPDAGLVNVKIGDRHGAADVTQAIAALDWIIQNATADGRNIRVVNLAMGTDSQHAWTIDPLAYAVEAAWRNGITVVVSGGNRGHDAGGLDMPAAHPIVLAVGTADTHDTLDRGDDEVAAHSSSGDTQRAVDVVAPGHRIISARAKGSFLDTRYPEAQVSRFEFRGSGSSQAAAVVSGAAALLLQEHPDWTPDQVAAALEDGATPLGSPTLAGHGLIDLAAANDATPGNRHPQGLEPATGTGSLDGSRGSYVVTFTADDGTTTSLTGERDFTGATWEGGSWAGSSWNGSSWNGSTWNGSSWNGSSWNASTWNGSSWNASTWNGSSWNTGPFTAAGWGK